MKKLNKNWKVKIPMVSEKQIRSLEYFRNKIVSFFVPSINRNFDEKQSIDYFVGKIVKLDEAGIWYEHPVNRCQNFIFYDKIISLSEEQFLPEQDLTVENDEKQVEKMNEELSNIDPQNMEIVVEEQQRPASLTVEDFRKFIS